MLPVYIRHMCTYICTSNYYACMHMCTVHTYICRKELESEIRAQVDELMREELKNLKLVCPRVTCNDFMYSFICMNVHTYVYTYVHVHICTYICANLSTVSSYAV